MLKLRLREIRRAADITQEQLADVMGTRQSVVSRIERGEFTPGLELAVRVVQALNKLGVTMPVYGDGGQVVRRRPMLLDDLVEVEEGFWAAPARLPIWVDMPGQHIGLLVSS